MCVISLGIWMLTHTSLFSRMNVRCRCQMIFWIDHFGKREAQLFIYDHVVYIAAKFVLRNGQLNFGRIVQLFATLYERWRTSQVDKIRIRLLMSRMSIRTLILLFLSGIVWIGSWFSINEAFVNWLIWLIFTCYFTNQIIRVSFSPMGYAVNDKCFKIKGLNKIFPLFKKKKKELIGYLACLYIFRIVIWA